MFGQEPVVGGSGGADGASSTHWRRPRPVIPHPRLGRRVALAMRGLFTPVDLASLPTPALAAPAQG